jgi:hypothetical protein
LVKSNNFAASQFVKFRALVESLESTDFIVYLFGKHTIISSIFAINRKIFRVF